VRLFAKIEQKNLIKARFTAKPPTSVNRNKNLAKNCHLFKANAIQATATVDAFHDHFSVLPSG
jgi:hypothetical protein